MIPSLPAYDFPPSMRVLDIGGTHVLVERGLWAATVRHSRGLRVVAARLTPREREVLSLAADGLQDKETAARLGISRQTVKAHLANVREKLGADNTIQAVAIAIRSGEID